MRRTEKICELKANIERQLTPLIGSDYVLLDLPYHTNIGDTLIWEGETWFLSRLPYKMLGCGSLKTWSFPKLSPKTTILLHGGGNFGDVWFSPHKFRLKVIRKYRDNPIIILPQTVHYDNPAKAAEDAAIMAGHPDLTICARDKGSYEFLRRYFSNRILCVPDMAFCIPPKELRYEGTVTSRTLIIDRTDKEHPGGKARAAQPGTDIADWPTMGRTDMPTWFTYKTSRISQWAARFMSAKRSIADILPAPAMKRSNIRKGVEFIGPYSHIQTNRLHGAILSLLMDKDDIRIVDNNYGKNSAFFRTWLEGTDGITLLER